MPIDPGLISAGTNALAQGANWLVQNAQNKQERQWQEKMYGIQRRDALADFAMQNAYNSPAAQMARLAAAGLNPNLVYKGGATSDAGPIRSSSVGSWTPKAPSFDAGSVLGSYLDTHIKQATVDNVKSQTEVNKLEGILKAAQTLATEASTASTRTSTEKTAFELSQGKRLADTAFEMATANVGKTLAETQNIEGQTLYTLNKNEREVAQNSMSLREAAERILRMRMENSKTQSEKEEIAQRIKNMQQDHTIKELDERLSKQGIRPSDPVTYRSLINILNGKTTNRDLSEIQRVNSENQKKVYIPPEYRIDSLLHRKKK